jgi:hypothetical protein
MFYIALDALYDDILTSETTTTLYCSIHRTLKIRKILKYLKNWRSKLAKIHSIIHHTLSPAPSNTRQWYVKKPTRTTEITRTPYGYHRWKRTMKARQRLLSQRSITWHPHLTYKAKSKCRKDPKDDLTFDSDSYQIMVDNGASYSSSNNINDFIEPPTKIGLEIEGFAGSLTTSLIGTVQWYITDDNGRTHSIILPNTSYVLTVDIRMLSPQHWAQVTNDLRGTLCLTYGDCFLLKWDKKRFRKTIPISQSTTKNVGIMTSAVGNNNHLNYCSNLESETPAIAFKSTIDFNTQAAVVSESGNEDQHIEQATVSVTQTASSVNKSSEGDRTHPLLVTFEDELDKLGNHPTFYDSIQEYMHWYYRLNCASFPTMLHMAKLKHLPKGISSILRRMERHHHKPPLCSDCIASKMRRK